MKTIEFAELGKSIRLNSSDRHEDAYNNALNGGTKIVDQVISEAFIHDGDIVYDVGANIGFCALVYLMNGATTVFSFEPHPIVFSRLDELSGGKLITYNIALSNSVGSTDLILSSSHNQGHTLSPKWAKLCPNVFGKKLAVAKVETSTLDIMVGDNIIDFLKVDIEGVESEFLDGAATTLTENTPRVVHIEIYPQVFDVVVNKLKLYYKHIKRCVVMKDQTLRLMDYKRDPKSVRGADLNHPPTFICVNDFDIIAEYCTIKE
jgi:FkbM family methyltransferase